jgi:cytochrome b subunit of formate dehydrogenase
VADLGVIGSMLVHNGLLFLRKLRAAYRSTARTVLRMNRSQRLQHLVLLVSFIVLAVTGFALKFPDSWIARALGSMNRSGAGPSCRRRRPAPWGALTMSFTACNPRRLQAGQDFFPTLKDLKDVVANARFLVGLIPKKPKFGRFGYAEKAEY